MNKRIIGMCFVGTVILCLCIGTKVSSNTVFHKQEFSREKSPYYIVLQKVNEIYENGDSREKLEIPVYYEAEILFDIDNNYALVRDSGFHDGTNLMRHASSGILGCYPTDAIRVKSTGTVYAVYDTESGYRLFVYFDDYDDYVTTVGFPIVIKNVLAFSDFKELRVGDSIEEVEKIDSVATLHKRFIKEIWNLDYKLAKALSTDGFPCTGLHYLKDGLLRIEYEMLEDGSLVISSIELYEDYILKDILGNEIDYTINKLDLPNHRSME